MNTEPENTRSNVDSPKLTFGLTTEDIEAINKYTSRWEGAEYSRDTWIRVGKKIGWEPLTDCFWWFRKCHCQ